MRNFRTLLCVSALVLSACQANSGMQGTLKVVPGQNLNLKASDGKDVRVDQDVPVALILEDKGLIFSSTATMKLDGAAIQFTVPKVDYLSSEDFNVPADQTGQAYGFKVQSARQVGKTWTEDGKQDCTHSGYCSACGVSTDLSGKMTTSCSTGWRSDCDGTENVVLQKTESATTFHADIVNGQGSVIAQFESAPQEEVDSKVLQVTSTCE